MKTLRFFAAAALAVSVISSCNSVKEYDSRQEFWLGADLGWITEYEANGCVQGLVGSR